VGESGPPSVAIEALITLLKYAESLAVGAGYLRVPNPQRYNVLSSRPIIDDSEHAQIYQASIVHQMHCIVCVLLLTTLE
jgi:hypothetical protein